MEFNRSSAQCHFINDKDDVVVAIGGIHLMQIWCKDDSCHLRNGQHGHHLLLHSIEDNHVAISLSISVCMKCRIYLRFYVWIRSIMGNEQQVRLWIQSLEVKVIERHCYAWCRWALAAKGGRQRTGQRDVLLQRQLMRKGRCSKLLHHSCRQQYQHPYSYTPEQPCYYSRSSHFRRWRGLPFLNHMCLLFCLSKTLSER